MYFKKKSVEENRVVFYEVDLTDLLDYGGLHISIPCTEDPMPLLQAVTEAVTEDVTEAPAEAVTTGRY